MFRSPAGEGSEKARPSSKSRGRGGKKISAAVGGRAFSAPLPCQTRKKKGKREDQHPLVVLKDRDKGGGCGQEFSFLLLLKGVKEREKKERELRSFLAFYSGVSQRGQYFLFPHRKIGRKENFRNRQKRRDTSKKFLHLIVPQEEKGGRGGEMLTDG